MTHTASEEAEEMTHTASEAEEMTHTASEAEEMTHTLLHPAGPVLAR
jgi:hypothetical protein